MCDNICVNCRYYQDSSYLYGPYTSAVKPMCKKTAIKRKDCVTGEEITEYKKCSEKNKDGCCEDFEPLVSKTIVKELQDLKEEFSCQGSYASFRTSLVDTLLQVLSDKYSKDKIIAQLIKTSEDNGLHYGYSDDEEDKDDYEYWIEQEYIKILLHQLNTKRFKKQK